ncbi:hypothetical protein AK830_g5828 [Neonectria ditissima]|uniref:FAD-binding domain-containing protein n=1 Tax=Neonectria ditissima TaxID=78410 RepID=A0A0P7BL07_9HYPO|nr:hypothetical protein AK830_g5828 [Neonectria ditissima]
MAPLKVLICGGGIAGPALAFWLSKLGHDVTIVERFPSLRVKGQQLDLRGPGISVMNRMGLEQLFRKQGVDEAGMECVNDFGKRKAFFPVNRSGKGLQSFSTEYEIMRGDLCRMFFEQDDNAVRVKYSNGQEDQFDLLVGADGQGSRTRRMMLGPDAPNPFHSLGLYIAYFTVPREEEDEHAPETIQAYLGYGGDSSDLDKVSKEGMKEQMKVWARLFDDAAWKTPRLIRDMQKEATADDFYCHEVGQVKLDSWSNSRVVLLGDAAYCPSPVTGMGTTSGLVGAYVLAGEIGKYCNSVGSSNNVENPLSAALEAYDARFRPFMEQVQTLGPGMPGRKDGDHDHHSDSARAPALRFLGGPALRVGRRSRRHPDTHSAAGVQQHRSKQRPRLPRRRPLRTSKAETNAHPWPFHPTIRIQAPTIICPPEQEAVFRPSLNIASKNRIASRCKALQANQPTRVADAFQRSRSGRAAVSVPRARPAEVQVQQPIPILYKIYIHGLFNELRG